MALNLLRGALRTPKFNSLGVSVRCGSHAAGDVKPAYVIKFDPRDDFYFQESLRHPIPNGPRMIVIPEDLKELKEKEKGDWKCLSVEEQMDLYNMYFGMSIAEMRQGSDKWKSSLGIALLCVTYSLMWFLFYKSQVLPPRDPYLSSEQHMKDNIAWQLKTFTNPITGYPSKYDYENNRWKD